jgi:hypothetical protein
MTGITVNEWVVAKRFLRSKTRRQPGNQEIIQLWAYDPLRKEYRSWYFNSLGEAGEWTGHWDEGTKTLAGKSGTTGVGKARLIDRDTLAWSVVARDQDGQVVLDLRGKSSRRKAPPDRARDEQARPGPPKPPELRVLDRLVGTWTWDLTGFEMPDVAAKGAESRPKKVATTAGTFTWEWVLDGRFLQEKSIDHLEEVEGLGMWTYDSRKKAFRIWRFGPNGTAVEFVGKWDEGSRTLSYEAEAKGITSKATERFLNNDTHEMKVILHDKEGKEQAHMEGKLTRRK